MNGITQEIIQIDIDELREGMFVGDVFNEHDVLLLSSNTLIDSPEQIIRLRNSGIHHLQINLRKGIAPIRTASAAEEESHQRELEYYKELPRALEIRQETLSAAKDALLAIRKGRVLALDKIENAAEEMVQSILRNSDALISLCQIKGHDEYTYMHSVNVGVLVASLAHAMNYHSNELLHVGIGGILHDIGKMRVPEQILNKPGKYADWEYEIMKQHPEHGLSLIEDKKNIPQLSRLIVIQHHERYNGKGYPYGLCGTQINEVGLMAAVADVYDALTSDRVYRAAWTPQKALALIFTGCDQDYSRSVVERFTRMLGVYPVGSFVKLGTGELGVVTRVEPGKLLAPIITVLFDPTGARLATALEYDLSELQKSPNGAQYKIEVSLNPKAFRIDVSQFIGKSLGN